MYNYCTLFDKNYLTRGLAMYESLKKYTKNFHLYILVFDKKSEQILKKLKLLKVTVISLQEFETPELLKIKKTRTQTEYCWTCTPNLIKHIIEKFQLEICTYLDADLYFYANPSGCIEEMKNKHVAITEHRYSPQLQYLTTSSGKYCVQFVTFKSTPEGMKILEWWKNACNEWCYSRIENGKFGDQKYLDDWTSRFKGIHVVQNLGGGVAPWNCDQYDFLEEKKEMRGIKRTTKKTFQLIFYHFHSLKIFDEQEIRWGFGVYKINQKIMTLLYKPYLKHLKKIQQKILTLEKNFQFFDKKIQLTFFQKLKQKILKKHKIKHQQTEIIKIPTFTDSRGSLSVIEKQLPFRIKRIFYLYNLSAQRGGHRHKKTIQGLICVKGSCEVHTNDGTENKTFFLNQPAQCLILKPKDWHTMDNFLAGTILLILASEYYDKNDYIYTKYQ